MKKEILLDNLKDVCKQHYTRFFELFIEILEIIERQCCVEWAYERVEKKKIKLVELLSTATEVEKIALRNELEELENESEQIKEELYSPVDKGYRGIENLVVEIIGYLLIDESDNEDLIRKFIWETSKRYGKKISPIIYQRFLPYYG